MDKMIIRKILSDIIQIKTVNPPGDEKKLALYFSDFLKSFGFMPKIEDLGNNRANLICEIGSGTARRIIFNGHMDVVPAEGDWHSDPFILEERNGFFIARGSCDMKAGLVSMILAFMNLREHVLDSDGRLKLVFVCDEETNNLGLNCYLANNTDSDCCENYVLIGEPTGLAVCNGHLGAERFWITIKGKSAHSSKPWLGCNAISAASSVIKAIDKYNMVLQSSGSGGIHPSCAVTLIEGGEKQNSIPAGCRIYIDRRTMPGEKSDSVCTEINKIIGNCDLCGCSYDLNHCFSFNAGILDPNDDFVTKLIGLESGRKKEPEIFPAGCEQGIFLNHGYKAAVLGPGNIQNAHMPDEKILCTDIYDAIRIYEDAVKLFI